MIPSIVRVIGAAALGALLAYNIGWFRGESKGYAKRVAEVAIADGKAELERRGDDAKLQQMSDYDLCVLGLRASGLSIEACEQLRGVHAE